jgi:outer membrane protein assembly factor BamB
MLVFAVSPSALGQERVGVPWPQFQGGPGHPGALEDGPEPPYRMRWSLVAPDDGRLSSVAVSGGVAVTMGATAVYGVDLETGDVVWDAPRIGGPLSTPAVDLVSGTVLFTEGPAADEPAPTGTPSVAASASESPSRASASPSASPSDDEDHPEAFLVAVDAVDLAERWRVPLDAISRTGVAIDGDTAYVGDDAGTVYAVSIEDGTLRWRMNAGEANGPCTAVDAGRVDVPLTIADGRVVAVSREIDQGSVVVSAFAVQDGACAWRRAPQVGLTSTSSASAVEGLVVIGLPDRYVRGLDGESGEPRWSSLALKTFWPSSSPALVPGAAYVADLGGGLYRFDSSDGTRVWGYQFNEFAFRSSPVVSGGAVLLGLDDGRLVAVDAESGHLVWQSDATPGPIGTIALAGDVVVATKGGPDAGLVAFESDPTGRLIDVPSPTELRPGTTLGRIGAAAAIVLVVVLVPGLLLRRRVDVRIEEDDVDEEDADDGEEGAS